MRSRRRRSLSTLPAIVTLTYDGIHMSPRGNELLANEFVRCITEALSEPK